MRPLRPLVARDHRRRDVDRLVAPAFDRLRGADHVGEPIIQSSEAAVALRIHDVVELMEHGQLAIVGARSEATRHPRLARESSTGRRPESIGADRRCAGRVECCEGSATLHCAPGGEVRRTRRSRSRALSPGRGGETIARSRFQRQSSARCHSWKHRQYPAHPGQSLFAAAMWIKSRARQPPWFDQGPHRAVDGRGGGSVRQAQAGGRSSSRPRAIPASGHRRGGKGTKIVPVMPDSMSVERRRRCTRRAATLHRAPKA